MIPSRTFGRETHWSDPVWRIAVKVSRQIAQVKTRSAGQKNAEQTKCNFQFT
jgi:hypothetical protein